MIPIPEFKKPPLNEVAIGVGFSPIERWAVPYFGLFWQQIRSQFPIVESYPPLPLNIEQIPRQFQNIVPMVQFADPNALRVWYQSQDQTKLIQVQRDQFIRNWRRIRGDEVYPRYQTGLRQEFSGNWEMFRTFLAENDLAEPTVLQCEIHYINEIEQGECWQSMSDLPNVIPLWSSTVATGYLQAPESAGFSLSYLMPNQNGRVRVTGQHGLRTRDGKEILSLQLTARGKPESNTTSDILKWLDFGREAIVRAFADVTTPAMHTIWERTS